MQVEGDVYREFRAFLRTQAARELPWLQLVQLRGLAVDHDLTVDDYVKLSAIVNKRGPAAEGSAAE